MTTIEIAIVIILILSVVYVGGFVNGVHYGRNKQRANDFEAHMDSMRQSHQNAKREMGKRLLPALEQLKNNVMVDEAINEGP